MGKSKKRLCLICIDRPIIDGDSWAWHCKSKHFNITKLMYNGNMLKIWAKLIFSKMHQIGMIAFIVKCGHG